MSVMEANMENKYEFNSKIFNALSDPNRLRIVELLSSGELCGCKILEHFNFTQPTLSHHMKVLIDCGLVEARKVGIWSYYKLNTVNANKIIIFITSILKQ